MRNHRNLFLLVFALVLISLALVGQKVSSQASTDSLTNQADKVSGTGITVAGSTCPHGIDCEGDDPQNTTNFTFDASDGATPRGTSIEDPNCDPCPGCVCPLIEAAEAPAAFDNLTNDERFLPQGSPIPRFPPDPGPTPGTFEADKFIFGFVDEIEDGLGPVYNAQSCRECHQNPVVGGISQTTENRAGHNVTCSFGKCFVDAPGGSLINDRAIPSDRNGAKIQERVPPLFTAGIVPKDKRTGEPQPPIVGEEDVRTFRTSLNLLGDGFVEAIANGTMLAISNAQSQASHGQVHGQALAVPVLEANFVDNRDCSNPDRRCTRRIGRFGWKDQIPSLLSFSGDAYLNEIGITNFLILNENTSLGRFVGFIPPPGSNFDTVPDDTACEEDPTIICGEDTERDIDTFTKFMRATKAPPQDADIQADSRFADDIKSGRDLFTDLPNGPGYSCSLCHVPAIISARPGTIINGGEFPLPDNLSFKILRPFSDFLLHDVGTGDGIVQNGGQDTRLKVRTPALWGVRTRTRLMHDGESLTFMEAILRHQGEAAGVTAAFEDLSDNQKRQLITFLESL
ncbi:MAG TPA: di-heme oxidoredictase family protein [Pyrinomonadaceae bacterium]|nr:di-heme oxidoredictase family protein [Pyrinomonadaceae bacterium]